MIRREADCKAQVPRGWGGIRALSTVDEFTYELLTLLNSLVGRNPGTRQWLVQNQPLLQEAAILAHSTIRTPNPTRRPNPALC